MLKFIASLLFTLIPFTVSAQNIRVTETTELLRPNGTVIAVRFEYDKEAKFSSDKFYRDQGEKLYRETIASLVKYDGSKIVNDRHAIRFRYDPAFEVAVRPVITDHVFVKAYTPHPGVSFVLIGESVSSNKLGDLPSQLDALHEQARRVATIVGTRVD